MGISNIASNLRPGIVTSTTRPATPYEGQVIYETDTDKVLVWNGSNWDYLKTNIVQPVEQPMFFVSNDNNAGGTKNSTTKITFSQEVVNIGNCWSTSNNRFTAPINGKYEFSFSCLPAFSSATTLMLYKNNSAMAVGSAPRGYGQTQYSSISVCGIIPLNAGDYIELYVTTGSIHSFHSFFSGKLVA